MDAVNIVQAVLERATCVRSSVHGLDHWQRVATVGAVLAQEVPGADPEVVHLFGYLHDAMRNSDGEDLDHGRRASGLARELRAEGVFTLSDPQMKLLERACDKHTYGAVSENPTIGVCWDADRLDLPRVGIQVAERYLSTEPAKQRIVKPGSDPFGFGMPHAYGTVGWRLWIVRDGLLVSPGLAHFIWEPDQQEHVAHCYRGYSHQVPARRCTCGLCAVKERETLAYFINNDWRHRSLGVIGKELPREPYAVGEVALYGPCIEDRAYNYGYGWRAQRARIRSIFVPTEELREGLADYGVPVEIAELPSVKHRLAGDVARLVAS